MKNGQVLNKMEHYILNNGVEIPAVAFGTYKAADGKSADVIRTAIEAGYRYFDTASFYGTETYLAEAVRESGISRDEIFIASKLWKTEMGYDNVKSVRENVGKSGDGLSGSVSDPLAASGTGI